MLLLYYIIKISYLILISWFLVNYFFNYLGTVPFLFGLLLSFSIAIWYLFCLGLSYYIILVYFIYLTVFPIFFIYACNFLGLLNPTESNLDFLFIKSFKKYLITFLFIVYIIGYLKIALLVDEYLYTFNIKNFFFGTYLDSSVVFVALFNSEGHISIILGLLLLISLTGILGILQKLSKHLP